MRRATPTPKTHVTLRRFHGYDVLQVDHFCVASLRCTGRSRGLSDVLCHRRVSVIRNPDADHGKLELSMARRYLGRLSGLAFLAAISCCLWGQQTLHRVAPPSSSAPDASIVHLDTPDFKLSLAGAFGTVAGLEPKGAGGFDFTPAELLKKRSGDGYYHLGDIDLRLREQGTKAWRGYSTAYQRRAVKRLPAGASQLERDDLTPALPSDFPLQIVRTWALEDGKLVLRFSLSNPGPHAVEIGALGIPLIFDNLMTGKNLEQAHALCSFSDPSIAMDAGYVQVTRLNGHGPALVVAPDGRTPLEAYRPIDGPSPKSSKVVLFADRTPRSITFEGFYEWMVVSGAYQEGEWKGVTEWNPAATILLQPGEERTFGLRFLLSKSIRSIEQTLISNERPVAVGIPGYVLPMDQEGYLFLKYPHAVRTISVEPGGAIEWHDAGSTIHGWHRYALHGRSWGNARVTIAYEDGLVQTVHFRVIKPEVQAVEDMGHFLFTRQWFDVPTDPFHRSPSVISYDNEAHATVTQDHRVWIAGLSDEGGAGSWLAAAMKEYVRPDRQEVAQLEQFVDGVLWGSLQYKDGPTKYGVRKSLFYYQPDKMPAGFYRKDQNWSTWASWNEQQSALVDRSYDYPHVAAVYWVLYRLARDHQGLVTHHDWRWYLTQAYETTLAMTRYAPQLAQFGQMEGSVFLAILDDLKREGMNEDATEVEAEMRARANVWQKLAYPFGSEMPWDSTGQEEVYAWSRYFGMDDKAQVTLDAITGYMPTIPNWGYNGSARRYWDFLFAGKYARLERQLHHYGSGLNAIPVLDAYRRDPRDFYLLRVGYGGTMGAITGIDRDGFASAAFHSYPDMLRFDPYSGDYGPNFFGHAWTTAAYLVRDPEFGWLAFGGNVTASGHVVDLQPRDSLRQRVYLAPLGLWLTLDSGRFQRIVYDTAKKTVLLELEPADAMTTRALLRVEQPVTIPGAGHFAPKENLPLVRGAFAVPLGPVPATIVFTASD